MSVLILLISLSLFVALGFLVAFIWATKSGQYEDKYTPSIRMLMDDMKEDKVKTDIENKNQKKGS